LAYLRLWFKSTVMGSKGLDSKNSDLSGSQKW